MTAGSLDGRKEGGEITTPERSLGRDRFIFRSLFSFLFFYLSLSLSLYVYIMFFSFYIGPSPPLNWLLKIRNIIMIFVLNPSLFQFDRFITWDPPPLPSTIFISLELEDERPAKITQASILESNENDATNHYCIIITPIRQQSNINLSNLAL